MQPIYIFITVLAFIAAKLIYDTTLGKSEAERTLTELSDRQAAITAIFEKVCELSKNLNPREEISDQAQLFGQITDLYNQIIAIENQIDVLEKVFNKQLQKLPATYAMKFANTCEQLKTIWTSARLNNNWDSADLIKNHRAMHMTATSRFIKSNYSQQALSILELAEKFLTNTMTIQLKDGRTIDKEQVKHDIEKFQLNEKLKKILPPKPKTKVVKI